MSVARCGLRVASRNGWRSFRPRRHPRARPRDRMERHNIEDEHEREDEAERTLRPATRNAQPHLVKRNPNHLTDSRNPEGFFQYVTDS